MNYNFNLSNKVWFIISFFCFLISCLGLNFKEINNIPYFLLLTVLFIFSIKDKFIYNNNAFVIALIGILLYIYPYIILFILKENFYVIFFSIYWLSSFLFLSVKCDNKNLTKKKFYTKRVTIFYFFILSISSLIGILGYDIFSPLLWATMGIQIIFIEKYLNQKETVSKLKFFFISAPFFLSVTLYLYFYWGGFGRLLIGTYVLYIIYLLNAYKVIQVKMYFLLLICPFLIIYGTYLRYSDASITNKDSSTHHIEIMTELLQNKRNLNINYSGLLDQFFLYFFNWLPRNFYPNKPVSLGYSFVDDYVGREGFGEGFSISMGFSGEHLYYGESTWIFTCFLLVIITTLLLKLIIKISLTYKSIAGVYVINLISLFWGGMATFGSRVWWFLIPMIIFVWLEKLLSHKNKF